MGSTSARSSTSKKELVALVVDALEIEVIC